MKKRWKTIYEGKRSTFRREKLIKNKQKVLALRAIALLESFPAFEFVVNPLDADA